jgi:phosphopantetheinyl transferase
MVKNNDLEMKCKEIYFINFIDKKEKKYRLILSTGKYDESIQKFRSSLSKGEEEVLKNFKVNSRQNEFIAGRILAKNNVLLIKEKFKPTEINIISGVWGFPIFDTTGINRMWVSIAHSREYAASLLSEVGTHPIGVDIEEIRPENDATLAFFLKKYKKSLSLEEKHIYWTAKEAVSKALRTGFTISETLFEISEITLHNSIYIIAFKHLPRLQVLTWIKNNIVISIAYPKELEFDSIRNMNL